MIPKKRIPGFLSRKDFIVKAIRWVFVSVLASLGIYNINKRNYLEKIGGCLEIDTCSGCKKYKGCQKPEKV